MISTLVRTRRGLMLIGLAIVMLSLVLAVSAINVSSDLTHRQRTACDGTIPMPASAFVLSWSAVALAAMAMILAVVAATAVRAKTWSVVACASFAGAGILALLTAVLTGGRALGLIGVAALGAAVAAPSIGPRRGVSREDWAGFGILVAALLAVLFTVFVLHAIFQDAQPDASICFG